MADELDLSRLAELQQLLDSGLPQIVDTLLKELDRALGAIGGALGDGDLPAAALEALEAGARRDDVQAARQAHRRVGETWPPLRSQLEHAAARNP